ncbi:MAG: ImmA/IrrE family metallo-endopeptidase [Planctomycetales bacterium]
MSEPDAEAWDASQHAWWMRHALPACRQGGLFPDIVIRRMQDSIEFSWGPSSRAGTPPHFYFLANHGYARIDPRIVAKSFSDVIGPAIEHLCSEASDEPAFSELRAAFQTLSNVDRLDQQLALICGLHSGTRDILRVRSDFQSNRLTSFTTEKRSRLVVEDAPQFCLMFGSVAPDIDEQDVEQLIGLVASICHPYQENELLRKLVCDAPIRSALERPWDRGYALAEDLHQALEGRYRDGSLVDVEALVADLGIAITSIELNDKTIRAIAIAGEECRPTVAINTRYKYQHSHPRRFTLAHELCHILHDRTHGVRLALASGPWAPVDVEKRANAFAAMFLMPPELIRAVIEQDQIDLESVQGLRAASKRLEVSFSALIEHVCNLGFIDEATHDELKQQDIQNSAPKMLP